MALKYQQLAQKLSVDLTLLVQSKKWQISEESATVSINSTALSYETRRLCGLPSMCGTATSS